jgi:hypothetical protein
MNRRSSRCSQRVKTTYRPDTDYVATRDLKEVSAEMRCLMWVARASGEPRGGSGVVRCPEGSLVHEGSVALTGSAVDLGDLEALLHAERRQYPR